MMKSANARRFEWLPAAMAVLSVFAFLLLLFAFYVSVMAFQVSIDADARRDLEFRVELAAKTLTEPLRTLDFATIRAFGEACGGRGYELSIKTGEHGLVFDTRRKNRFDSTEHWVSSGTKCGDFNVLLMRSRESVFAPFSRMYRLFVLAALVGASGMFAVFFVLYRQRVRIRELAKLEKFRREFIADVSHEIKTPLTGILGAVDLLASGAGETPPPQGAEPRLVSLIKKEAKRLNGLVQSILDLARLEREGDVLNIAKTDLGELARGLAAKFEVDFRGGDVSSPQNLIRCDAQLIEQAVSNLIVNAVRHSGSREISVLVECDAKAARIIVEDHGVGIPPEHAPQVFERFHRVDPARAAETGGAGLGLAIVRRIARLHGGDVTLAPAKPHGCRFELSIPM